jgi:lysophospholipase L1-like esterase
LARIEQETKVRIWPSDPITVVISIGTNDDLFESDKQWVTPEEFEQNLENIIKIVSPLAEYVVLVGNVAVDEARTTPVFWGDFHYTNKELERSERIIEKVSKQHNLPYVPIFQPFLEELDKGKDLLADGLHPNAAGHQFIAERVLTELKKLL